MYTPFVVALATATAVIPSLITGDWNYWVYTALTFLMISCPCALVLSVPPVSYTHLDVYKRQVYAVAKCWNALSDSRTADAG